jgi:septum site-determining protein MinD
MGCERRVVYDLINVIQGEATLNQALIKDKHCDNLFVLAASQTRDKEALTQGRRREGAQRPGGDGLRVHRVRLARRHRDRRADGHALRRRGAGGDQPRGVLGARLGPHPGHAVVSKTKRAIDGKEPIKEHLLITRYNPNRVDQGQMLSLEDIQDILRIKLIGVIPGERERAAGQQPGHARGPHEGQRRERGLQDVVDRFLGEDKPMRFVDPQKPGLLKRLFGRK